MPDQTLGGSTIGRSALLASIDELKNGAGEIGGNNKGKWVKKYLQPVGLGEGNPWCAAFLSWCFLQAAGGDKKKMPFRYSAGARDIFNQLKNNGLSFKSDDTSFIPQPGDSPLRDRGDRLALGEPLPPDSASRTRVASVLSSMTARVDQRGRQRPAG